jgi:hypothetical protein
VSRANRTRVLLFIGAVLIVAVAAFFPRVLAFFELAARELRYLWWLVLLVALGLWITIIFG